jgi:hypothetical protein
MNIETYREMLEQDLKFDEIKLDIESLRIPQLHGKYLNFYHNEKRNLHILKKNKANLFKLKWEYYTGRISKEDLDANKWEAFDHKILRQDVDLYLESDKDLQELDSKIFLVEEKVDYLESILKTISNRQFHIRDAIAWRKFINGVV